MPNPPQNSLIHITKISIISQQQTVHILLEQHLQTFVLNLWDPEENFKTQSLEKRWSATVPVHSFLEDHLPDLGWEGEETAG
jgi:hypothetical protein